MKQEPLYIALYTHYKELIQKGTLSDGVKLPSIRRCAMERRLSRTTVEAAYMQLVAEGYVTAKQGSGYYVNQIDCVAFELAAAKESGAAKEEVPLRYDFTSATVDVKSFNFDMWRRYIKSALRNTERLLSYGDVQGEYDLRVALCHYIREKRGVVCTPEQIVIGAGMQTLLNLLCSLLQDKGVVGFTGQPFEQGKVVFQDRGFQVVDYGERPFDATRFRQEGIKTLYVAPSHTTPWGDVMRMRTRVEWVQFARLENCMVIEDDYDSEFNYYTKPTASLQGLEGGENIIYMSTFSKLLLPSLRMSFMVVPTKLMAAYEAKKNVYNQTVSKVEQIAMCQFIVDGHLEKQLKKTRKVYLHKKTCLCQAVETLFGKEVKLKKGIGGFVVGMMLMSAIPPHQIIAQARAKGIKIQAWSIKEEGYNVCIALSCSGVDESKFIQALTLLKESIC